MAVEGALIGFGVAAARLGGGALEDIEEFADGDGARGLAEEAGAEVGELLVGVDLGLDLGGVDVFDEREEGDVVVGGERG